MPDVAAHWQHTSAETAPFDYTWRSGLMSRLGLDVGAMPAGGRFAPDAPPASYMGPGAWGRGLVHRLNRLTPRARNCAMLPGVGSMTRTQGQWRAADSQDGA